MINKIIKSLTKTFSKIFGVSFAFILLLSFSITTTLSASVNAPKTQSTTAFSKSKQQKKQLRVGIICFCPYGGHYTAAVAVQSALSNIEGVKANIVYISIPTSGIRNRMKNRMLFESNGKLRKGMDKIMISIPAPHYDEISEKKIGFAVSQLLSIKVSSILDSLKKEGENIYQLSERLKKEGLGENDLKLIKEIINEEEFNLAFNLDERNYVKLSQNALMEVENILNSRHGLFERFSANIDLTQFDLLISVSPWVQNEICYKIIDKANIPLVCLITDADIICNGSWIDNPNVLYLCCSDALMRRAKIQKLPYASKISGLPLRDEFKTIRMTSKAEMKKKLGFEEDKPLVLVDFGAGGQQTMTEIAKILKDIKAVFICAKCAKTKREIDELQNRNHRIFNFVDAKEKAEYMRAADLIVGKPGGLTTFEALECETPLVIVATKLIPNETPNAQLLLENGLCRLINDYCELPYVIKEIMLKNAEMAAKSKKQNKFVNNSSEEIAEIIKDIQENYDQKTNLIK